MKKIGLVIISLFTILIISGCGSNTKKLTCSGITPGTNMNADSTVEYIFENDKLSKSKINVVFKDITVSNLSTVWDKFKEQFTQQNPPIEDKGFKRTVSSDDDNYTFSVNIEIDFNKISKETMEKYSIEDYRNKSYSEVKEKTENERIKCK